MSLETAGQIVFNGICNGIGTGVGSFIAVRYVITHVKPIERRMKKLRKAVKL